MNHRVISHKDDKELHYERIYCICPKAQYGTPWYMAMREAAGLLCPHARKHSLITPVDLYTSNKGYKELFPIVMQYVEAVLVFPDEHSMIGRGLYDEIADASELGKPVFIAFLQDDYMKGLCCVWAEDYVTIRQTSTDYKQFAYVDHASLHKAKEEMPPVEMVAVLPAKPNIKDLWNRYKGPGRPPKH